MLKQQKLMQTQEDHLNPIQALHVDSLKVDLIVILNTCSEKEDSNSKTASSKSVKESILDYATKDYDRTGLKNAAHENADDADIRPIYDEEPMAKQTNTADMFDMAFEYIKDLQKALQVHVLSLKEQLSTNMQVEDGISTTRNLLADLG
ncbi:hypothetical protein Tco_0542938 [Tanacetum coccineum]